MYSILTIVRVKESQDASSMKAIQEMIKSILSCLMLPKSKLLPNALFVENRFLNLQRLITLTNYSAVLWRLVDLARRSRPPWIHTQQNSNTVASFHFIQLANFLNESFRYSIIPSIWNSENWVKLVSTISNTEKSVYNT